jgi:predicted nucleic acid-binding protein
MAPCYHLDANVVLRFLRNDDARQSPAAAKLFARAKSGQVRLAISAVTVAEIFYVLARVYKHTRVEAAARLIPLIQSNALEAEHRKRILDALRRVTLANVDFGDAYLAATAVESGDKVASFDADLSSFPDLTTLVPQ